MTTFRDSLIRASSKDDTPLLEVQRTEEDVTTGRFNELNPIFF